MLKSWFLFLRRSSSWCCKVSPHTERTQYLMVYLFDDLYTVTKKKSPTAVEPAEVLRSHSEFQGDRAENYLKAFLYKSFLSV